MVKLRYYFLFSILVSLFPVNQLLAQSSDSAFSGTQNGVLREALNLYGGGVEEFDIGTTGNLYAGLGSPNGIFCSTNSGSTWNGPGADDDFGSIAAVKALGESTVFFIGGIKLYRSQDACSTWEQLTPSSGDIADSDFGQSLAASTSAVIVPMRNGKLEVSRDGGDNFLSVTIHASVTAIDYVAVGAASSSTFYALCSTGGVNKTLFKSTDDGLTWSAPGVTGDFSRLGVSPSNSNIVVFSSNNGAAISTDGGATSTDMSHPGVANNAISFAGSRIYVGAKYTSDTSAPFTWGDLNTDATDTDTELSGHFKQHPTISSTAYIASLRGIAKATDTLKNWNDVVTGMLGVTTNDIIQATDKDKVFVGTQVGVALTSNYTDSAGPTWMHPIDVTGDGDPIDALIFPDATSDTTLLAGGNKGIYRSTNEGATWSNIALGALFQNRDQIVAFARLSDGTVVAGITNADSNSGRVIKSTDTGLTWSDLSITNSPPVTSLLADGTTLYVGVGVEADDTATKRGIYKFAEASWTQLGDAIAGELVRDLEIQNSKIYAATGDDNSAGVFVSADAGSTWTNQIGNGLPEDGIFRTLEAHPTESSTLFVASGRPAAAGYIYKTEDEGASWTLLYTLLIDEVPSALLFDDLIMTTGAGAFDITEVPSPTPTPTPTPTPVPSYSLKIGFAKTSTKSGKRKKYVRGTLLNEFKSGVADETLALSYKRKANDEFSSISSKTTNQKGKAVWRIKKKGIYRVEYAPQNLAKTKKLKK